MSSLSAFLHPEQTGNKEVIVSERFKENGKVVPFLIRPVTQEENEEIIRKNTKRNKKTGEEVFDRINYNTELTAAAVVEPDLRNAEFQKAHGVLGPEKLLKKILYVGEFAVLMEEVQELSGLDKDINDDRDEVKKR